MNEILRMENITKVYSNGVTANEDINFSINKGEIHALMGENGAGKSTLMKVLFGLEKRDSGEIFYKGEKANIQNPADAISLGIGMVNQHFMLVDSLKVYENVVLGMEPRKSIFIDEKKSIDLVNKYSEKFNLKLDPNTRLGHLSVSMKQKVEILKVLARGSELLILDEPTAVLTPQETEELFEQFLLLKKEGYTIIFISHKINEVKQICDRTTVLRNGKDIGTVETKDVTPEEISKLMVGRDVILNVNKKKATFGKELLKVNNVIGYNDDGIKVLNNVSFNLKEGQILGVAGVEGNGQNALAESIFGLKKVSSGEIIFQGKPITNQPVNKIRNSAISLIPEDRMETGIAQDLSIWENLISDKIDKQELKKHGLLNMPLIKNKANQIVDNYHIKSMNIEQNINMLSGGNIQKVVVAREMSSNPKILIANQPTRGIDVGAQEFIWNEILKFRDEGNAVLLISADLNEILELSDSVMIMINGEISAYFEDSDKLTEDELGLYMLGVKKQTTIEGDAI